VVGQTYAAPIAINMAARRSDSLVVNYDSGFCYFQNLVLILCL